MFKKKNIMTRYLLTGLVNTLIGVSVYPIIYLIFTPSYLNYFEALVISQMICVSIAYLNLKTIVFKTRGNWHHEIAKFGFFHGLIMLANIISLPLMVNYIELNPIIAQTCFSVLIIISGYFWHSKITFSKSEHV